MEYAFPRCSAIADWNNYKERDPEGMILLAKVILSEINSATTPINLYSGD